MQKMMMMMIMLTATTPAVLGGGGSCAAARKCCDGRDPDCAVGRDDADEEYYDYTRREVPKKLVFDACHRNENRKEYNTRDFFLLFNKYRQDTLGTQYSCNFN
jgi:hypothetical protein